MRALGRRNLEREFQLIKRLLQLGSWNRSDDGIAFVAHDVRLISADDAIQATETARRPERGVRERSSHNLPIIIHGVSFLRTAHALRPALPANRLRRISARLYIVLVTAAEHLSLVRRPHITAIAMVPSSHFLANLFDTLSGEAFGHSASLAGRRQL